MKFCTRCGGELLKESDTKYQCTHCRYEQFRNPKGAVGLLLIDSDGKLILTRRAEEPKKGALDQLGGFLDVGETFEDALYRELQEETGLTKGDVYDVTYVGSTHEYYHWQGEDEPVVSVIFSAKLKSNAKPIPADDVASLEHLELDDVPVSEVGWPGLLDMIEILKKSTNKNT